MTRRSVSRCAGLPGRVRLISSASLPWCAAVHTLFVPIFLTLAHPQQLPAALRMDAVAIAVVFMLGVCTGYIGCMGLILGAERGRSPEEKETAGMITSFSLMMGLAVGSFAGLLLSRLV